MKRYDLVGNYDMSIQEMLDGDYCLHEEAAAIIAEKDREIAEMRTNALPMANRIFELEEQLRTLQVKLEQAEKDADRYCWIRDNLNNYKMTLPPLLYLDGGDGASYGEPMPETLDAVIDALIAKYEEKKS